MQIDDPTFLLREECGSSDQLVIVTITHGQRGTGSDPTLFQVEITGIAEDGCS